ncbi:protein kinase [Kitasatospora sp. NPDC004745]|uniref:protein kinase domain-containing protein n=1 Tax=Kitasatospora sp. NPDC004745 TaxID=3364019 RepID=UPI003675FC24
MGKKEGARPRGQRRSSISSSVPGWQNLGPLLPTGKPFVRRARNGTTGEEAVLKFLSDQRSERQQRFFAEARRMNGMTPTPGVLPVLDIDCADEERPQWYVMPLAESLKGVLDEVESLQEVVAPFVVLADTLAALESEGIYHRDIKPDNLFWHDGGPVLADFGIAYWGEPGPTQPVEKVGPMGFLAPEMYTAGTDAGEVGASADVYGLAQTLYVVARREGRYPPGGPLRADEEVYAFRQWQDTRGISGFRHVLEAATCVTPSARLTMAELARQLRVWLQLERDSPILPRSSDNRILGRGFFDDMFRQLERDKQATVRDMAHALDKLADEYFSAGDDATEGGKNDWLGKHEWPEQPAGTVGVEGVRFVYHVEDPAEGRRVVLGAETEGGTVSFAVELQKFASTQWQLVWQSATTPRHQMRLPSVQQELAGLMNQVMDQLTQYGY